MRRARPARRLLLPIALLVAAGPLGCVPKRDYLDLEDRYTGSEEEVALLSGRIAQLEADLSAARSEALSEGQRLRAQLDEAAAERARLLDERSDLESSVEEMQRALMELARRQAAAEARVASYRDLLARFQELIDAGRLRVTITDGQMVVELPTDILFASGSASLSEEGERALAEVGAVLAAIPERRFQVAGHTDDVPIANATYPSNWELASARAITVLKTLVDAGVQAERVSAASYGETRPVASNETAEGREANRRIEIIVVPDLSDLPGYDELSSAVAAGDAP